MLPTILLLDQDQRRSGIIEQVLQSQRWSVFRISQTQKALELIDALKPSYLIVAINEETLPFYLMLPQKKPSYTGPCLLLTASPLSELRPRDIALDTLLQPQQLAAQIASFVKQHLPSLSTITKRTSRTDEIPLALQKPTPPGGHNPYTSGGQRPRDWKGLLSQVDIARLFSILLLRHSTGSLSLTTTSQTRRIWLADGAVIHAEASPPPPSIAALLVQNRWLQRPHLEQALPLFQMPSPGSRLYEAGLIEQAMVPLVENLVTEQAFLSCFSWEDGAFSFIPGVEGMPTTSIRLELPPLILQGVRSGYSYQRLLALVGLSSRIPQWFANPPAKDALSFFPKEIPILQAIDGKRSFDALLSALKIEPATLYAPVYALMVLGYITMKDTPGSDGVLSVQLPQGQRAAHPPTSNLSRVSDPRHSGAILQTSSGIHTTSALEKPSSLLTHEGERSKLHPPPHERITAESPLLHPGESAPSHPSQSSILRPGLSQRRPPSLHTGGHSTVDRGGSRPRPPSEILGRLGDTELSSKSSITDLVDQKYAQILEKDYFQILGIPPSASEIEIRRAYQRWRQTFSDQLLQSSFSDRFTEQVKEIHTVLQEAYDVLSDPLLRERYHANLDT